MTEATLMKPVGLISTGVLLLLLGAVAPTHAQQEQHEQDAKHPKQEEQAKPEKQQQDQNRQQQQDQNRQQQHAQQQQQDQNRQQQHAQQQQQDQNRQKQHAHQQQQDQNKQQQHAHQQVNRPSQQDQHRHEGEQRVAWQGDRAHNWQSKHRTWQQRGGYNGYRIPEDRYRGDFGPDHVFRIYSYPVVVVGGYPRFQYGGFWFSVVDPFQEYLAGHW